MLPLETSAKKGHSGFTLIEIMVTVAIIGILASIILVNISNLQPRSRDTKRLADIKQIYSALQQYYDENTEYPRSEPAGTAVTNRSWRCLGHSSSEKCWRGAYSGLDSLNTALYPYVQKIADDPRNKTSCYGDAYLYNSNHTGIKNRPAGAYLHWYFETGPKNDSSCGPGFYGGENWCGPYCWLYVGPGTP